LSHSSHPRPYYATHQFHEGAGGGKRGETEEEETVLRMGKRQGKRGGKGQRDGVKHKERNRGTEGKGQRKRGE